MGEMIIQFKLADDDTIYLIEGENLLLIKVALVFANWNQPIHYFQKTLTDSLLLYCPTEGDRNNLVNRNWDEYCKEHAQEIIKINESIRPIDNV
jgi:hypothetical protein